MKFTIEVHGEPDELNRSQFTLRWVGYNPWLDRVGPRGQVFHADVSVHIAKLKREGHEVVIEKDKTDEEGD